MIIVSFLIILIASFFLGTFGLGMKYNKPMAWEAFWGIHALTAMLVVPAIWTMMVVPNPWQSIVSAPPDAIVRGMVFGFIWGIGGVLFGLSIKYVGVSLTYGVVMGTTGAIGALVPLFQIPGFAAQNSFPFIILGIAVMLTGVIIIAYAGVQREKLQSESSIHIEGIRQGKEFWKGIVIVTIGGIFSAFINIGFASAQPVAKSAEMHGATTMNASMAAWVVVLWGAILFNLAYSIILLVRHNSWKSFCLPGTQKAWTWALLSGILWFGSMGFYGLGAARMGELGPVVGWPVFVGLSLIFSNFWAIRAGEWKGAEKMTSILYKGVVTLILATIILAYSNTL